MNSFDERLSKLEAAHGTDSNQASAFIFLALTADDEPEDDMPKMIWITGTDQQFLREEHESDEAFLAAANTEHLRIHGEPLTEWSKP